MSGSKSLAVIPCTVSTNRTYEFSLKWGIRGSGDGEVEPPLSVAVASDGSLYVADTYNHRVQKFTSEGVFVSKWGTEGTGDGQFDEPGGLGVAADGSVYVADSKNSRIQKFTSDGVFISKWGTEGTGDGQFDTPEGVAFRARHQFVVPDGFFVDSEREPAFGAFQH